VPNQNADNDIMSKWVGFNPPNFSSDDGGIGVNLRKAFDYYDKNKNNTIDHMEFESLMTDLGQKMTTERLAEAFDVRACCSPLSWHTALTPLPPL